MFKTRIKQRWRSSRTGRKHDWVWSAARNTTSSVDSLSPRLVKACFNAATSTDVCFFWNARTQHNHQLGSTSKCISWGTYVSVGESCKCPECLFDIWSKRAPVNDCMRWISTAYKPSSVFSMLLAISTNFWKSLKETLQQRRAFRFRMFRSDASSVQRKIQAWK